MAQDSLHISPYLSASCNLPNNKTYTEIQVPTG